MRKIFFPPAHFLLCGFLFFTGLLAHAQKKNAAFRLNIRKASSPITIDGIADEQAWKDAEKTSAFYMVLPMDTSLAKVRTDVSMTYDKDNLYLLAVCYNYHNNKKHMVESLRRDFSFLKNDNFLVFMDTFDDQTTGFSFGANAYGAQWDGTMYEGGKVDLNWDNKWTSAVKNYDDRWVFEAAIPFKTIRYKKGATQWGINFSRNDLITTEKSSWAPVSRQLPTASLSHTGTLVWDEAPPVPRSNISVIPYVLSGVSKDYTSSEKTVFNKNIGGDVKVSIGPSLNLDLTVRPDFSQVEVDKQVTNLSRFELFFPERRQFFLENGDLFANFGYTDIRPFFSRRIGLGVPIDGGARLSGKLDKNWRIGVMDMRTAKVNDSLPVQNFAVLSLQRKLFKRSNIGFIYIDKTSLNYNSLQNPDLGKALNARYNRNMGMEYNLASSNNIWTGKAMVLKSFSPGVSTGDWTEAMHLQYNSRKWLIYGQAQYVGENYNPEVGYVPRRDYIKFNPQLSRFFFPKSGIVLSHGPVINSTYYFDTKMNATDHSNVVSYLTTFRTKATLSVVTEQDYVKLLSPFDPTNTGIDSLAADTKHHWNLVGFDYVSEPQHIFTYTASLRTGGYYDKGHILTLSSDLGYRFQPYVNITMSTSYNQLKLPQPWGNTHFLLIGPRIDITFTNTLFFTTYIQYNQQLENLNVNARLQWRYKPASDIFLVYTDNYYPAPFAVKTRAFVLKFNYWWGI
ncbi:MAG: carbohydrate binding family 9 domain-containing protein [Chitinophagaceae bacterium]|nr:carbohydrate binding family 9 domain-containing protein [Chitinophagaceae bacterium]